MPVRVAICQNAIVETTNTAISKQKAALLELGTSAINICAQQGVKILCFQELWSQLVNKLIRVMYMSQNQFFISAV